MTTLDRALHELGRGNLEEGQRILESLRRQEPKNPDVLYNLGICYSELGKMKQSIPLPNDGTIPVLPISQPMANT